MSMNVLRTSLAHEYEYSKIVKLKCIQLEYAVFKQSPERGQSGPARIGRGAVADARDGAESVRDIIIV